MTPDYGVFEYRNDFDEVRWQPWAGSDSQWNTLGGEGKTYLKWLPEKKAPWALPIGPMLYNQKKDALAAAYERWNEKASNNWRRVD